MLKLSVSPTDYPPPSNEGQQQLKWRKKNSALSGIPGKCVLLLSTLYFWVQKTHNGCMDEEFQNFSTVVNVIEMKDRLCDPDFDLVIGVVQFFDLGGLSFRQVHDVV